jgi:hypothetical protein
MKEFKQLNTAAARLARLSLTPEAVAKSNGIDWQGNNIKMLAALEVRRNRGMAQLRDTVIALLRHEGKRVMMVKPLITKAEAQAAGRQLSQASKAIKLAYAEAVANSPVITEAEADRLSNQAEALTPEQILSLTKYRLSQFYRTDVDADLVMFDRAGATQAEIKSLERLLKPQLATDRTAGTINRNASTPQDWSRAALRSWLYEQSGLGHLARQIVAGEVVDLASGHTTPIAQFVRGHGEEFRLAFGFTNTQEMSDQQIVGVMLRGVGIRTKRNRRQETYSIDIEALQALLAIIVRREEADPHPLGLDVNQGCGSASNSLQDRLLPPPRQLIPIPQPAAISSSDNYGYPIDDYGIA